MAKNKDEQEVVESEPQSPSYDFTRGTNSVVAWHPEPIKLAYMVELPPDAPEEMFRAAKAFVDDFAAAEYSNLDKLDGRRITVVGVMIHPVDMPVDPDRDVFDADGNRVDTQVKERTVLRITHVDGKPVMDEFMHVGFVSDVVARKFRREFIPRYGIGNWSTALDFQVTGIITRNGRRTYNVKFLG